MDSIKFRILSVDLESTSLAEKFWFAQIYKMQKLSEGIQLRFLIVGFSLIYILTIFLW